VALPLLGINLYPMFTNKVVYRNRAGATRIGMTYGFGSLVQNIARLYSKRYGVPLFISETASSGSIRRRRQWLDDSISAVRATRAEGIPLIGYTWWPLFALVTWAYRQGLHPPEYYFTQMGLWNLDSNGSRVRTSLVDAYRELTERGTAAVGTRSETAAVETNRTSEERSN
jgi:beta-glucosidase/6-phospho-beta-glucosidase/beta-galactosidase